MRKNRILNITVIKNGAYIGTLEDNLGHDLLLTTEASWTLNNRVTIFLAGRMSPEYLQDIVRGIGTIGYK